jgi:hypothetical protein
VSFGRRDSEAGVIAPRARPSAPRQRHTAFARTVGAVGLIILTALLFWMLTDEAFSVTAESVSFSGLTHADEAEVRAHLADLERAPNVFRVRASDIVRELSTLPEVDAAYAVVTLPADVTVGLDERDPVFIWSDREYEWLVDEEGTLFAPALADPAEAPEDDAADGDGGALDEDITNDDDAADGDPAGAPAPGPAAMAAREVLPVVVDDRVTIEPPTEGSRLSAADLSIMRLLLAITPELLDSKAQQLGLRVDERHGYVLESDRAWYALFGHFTPTLQPPDVIPRQVQCLQWLLASEERKLKQVRLALSDSTCGTFTKIDVKPEGGN